MAVSPETSFVIADIPGLIEGAAEGAGLGIQFLKHLSRTGLLLHVVDIAPIDGSDPIDDIKIIQKELEKYSEELSGKERWLVLNKTDLLPADEVEELCEHIVDGTQWEGEVYHISAVQREGTQKLVNDIAYKLNQNRIESQAEEEPVRATVDEDFDF